MDLCSDEIVCKLVISAAVNIQSFLKTHKPLFTCVDGRNTKRKKQRHLEMNIMFCVALSVPFNKWWRSWIRSLMSLQDCSVCNFTDSSGYSAFRSHLWLRHISAWLDRLTAEVRTVHSHSWEWFVKGKSRVKRASSFISFVGFLKSLFHSMSGDSKHLSSKGCISDKSS